MTEQRISIYEGMFLFPQSAAADFQGMIDHVNEILSRADAEILAMKKWDERRLAYDIKGNKRGMYLLAYFKADRQRITGIERDCNLSELLLRSLVIRADHIPAEEIEVTDQRVALADEAALRKAEAESEAAKETAAATVSETTPESVEDVKESSDGIEEVTEEEGSHAPT